MSDTTGTTTAETVTCPQCGQVNPQNNRFCGNCGARMDAPAAAPPPPPAAAPEPVTATVTTPSAPPATRPLPPVPAVPVAPPPPPPIDPIARERERDRLLTLANVQRMRGQTSEALRTLLQALTLSEGMPEKQIAPTYELLGDLYESEGRLDEAMQAFGKAHELDQTRASAEKKFAMMTLRKAEAKDGGALADAMLRGESISELLASGAQGRRRNAGMAMFLSIVPGFGQFYNGEFVKGAILLGVWVLCLLVFAISPDRDFFFNAFARVLALKPVGNFPPLLSIVGVISVAVWLYSLVDAPFMAGKGPKTVDNAPKVDKTGWEV